MNQEKRTTVIDRKLARAQSIADRLATVPFVRLIALGNSVAMGTATELSDLDFFVVTALGRLWTARFFLLLKAKWLGLTKRAGKTADQADFGFWVDETALDLSSIALRADSSRVTSRGSEQSHPRDVIMQQADTLDDPYLSRWLATLIPLVDRGGVFERFMRVNRESGIVNRGRTARKGVISNPPARRMRDPVVHASSTGFLAEFTRRGGLEMTLGSWLGQPLEWLLFVIQRWKVWADPVANRVDPLTITDRSVHPEHSRRIDVVTTRSMLKLHHLDQRAKYRATCRSTSR